jgi:hypothetical protein
MVANDEQAGVAAEGLELSDFIDEVGSGLTFGASVQ